MISNISKKSDIEKYLWLHINQRSGSVTDMAPQHQLFDPGRPPDKLTASGQREGNGSTMSMTCGDIWDAATILMQMKTSSTQECLPSSNEETSNAKSMNSNKRTRDTESSKTSDQESTSRSPACVPFWTLSTKEWSSRLWSCTETGLLDSVLTYWNTSSRKKDAGSWYTVKAKASSLPNNSPKTLWPSQQSLSQLITENEQRKTEENADKENAKKQRKLSRSKAKKVYNCPRARKIRVYPKKGEVDTLKAWFGATRRAYNINCEVTKKLESNDVEMVERVRVAAMEVKTDKLGRPVIKCSKGRIYHLTRGWSDAKLLITRHLEKEGVDDWEVKVPQAVRDNGILDFEKAKRSGDAKNEEKSVNGDEKVKEQFKFRSRKDQTQTLEVNARDFNAKNGVCKRLIALMRTKKESLPDKAECAVRVQMDKMGRVFLCFVREVEVLSENQAPNVDGSFHGVASLDPGVRTFQAIYDADGQGIMWGDGDMSTVFKLCREADKIQQKISKKRATYSLRHAYYRIVQRIKDKVIECHRKLALFLCENFRTILIPDFGVKRMIRKRDRKLNRKTVRQMCTWSHYAFRQSLLSKAELFPWVSVVVVDESYTSKTCEECGSLHQKLGGNKKFKCPCCGFTADRDLHAARNILLRYLTREGIPLPERLGNSSLRVLDPVF